MTTRRGLLIGGGALAVLAGIAVILTLIIDGGGDGAGASDDPVPAASEAPGKSPTPPDSPGHAGFDATEFVECMADQGVEVGPAGPAPGTDPALAQQAFQLCGQFLPGGAGAH